MVGPTEMAIKSPKARPAKIAEIMSQCRPEMNEFQTKPEISKLDGCLYISFIP